MAVRRRAWGEPGRPVAVQGHGGPGGEFGETPAFDQVALVRFFQQMFAAGLTSRRITELLPCWDSGHTDAGQRAMLRAERDRIQAKVDDLLAALDRLDEVIAITDTHP